jgi:hypothetical protein
MKNQRNPEKVLVECVGVDDESAGSLSTCRSWLNWDA